MAFPYCPSPSPLTDAAYRARPLWYVRRAGVITLAAAGLMFAAGGLLTWVLA